MEEIRSFSRLVELVKGRAKRTLAVVAAEDQDVLEATVHARGEGIVDVIYIGEPDHIRRIASDHQIDLAGIEIMAAADPVKAGEHALQLIKNGTAHLLMKGKIATSQILHLVLNDHDLKGDGDHFLSHVTVFEWEGCLKLFSDAALNIAPDVEQKRRITQNTLQIARRLGIPHPRIAFLSAVETINPKMPSSAEAAELAAMEWGDAIAGGPLAFDGAAFEEAYRTKGVPSPVEGKADMFICPNIETGNLFYKILAWMVKPRMAGIMAGSPVPFILTSRSDSAEVKFLSIATAIYLATSC